MMEAKITCYRNHFAEALERRSYYSNCQNSIINFTKFLGKERFRLDEVTERLNGIQEVSSSIPLISTKNDRP